MMAVTIRVNAPSGDATVTLSHASDPDLDVVLASGHTADATIAAKAWSTVLDKAIAIKPGVTLHPSQPRSLKPGDPAAAARCWRLPAHGDLLQRRTRDHRQNLMGVRHSVIAAPRSRGL